MTLKTIKSGFRRSRDNYSSLEDYAYEGESYLITPAQRRKIISFYYTFIQNSDEREAKILELDGLSSTEANQVLLEFETCAWNTVR
jgi:hypothetical protein